MKTTPLDPRGPSVPMGHIICTRVHMAEMGCHRQYWIRLGTRESPGSGLGSSGFLGQLHPQGVSVCAAHHFSFYLCSPTLSCPICQVPSPGPSPASCVQPTLRYWLAAPAPHVDTKTRAAYVASPACWLVHTKAQMAEGSQVQTPLLWFTKVGIGPCLQPGQQACP